MRDKVKQAIGLVFVPDGVWNIEEGRRLENAAKAAIAAMLPDEESAVEVMCLAYDEAMGKLVMGLRERRKELGVHPADGLPKEELDKFTTPMTAAYRALMELMGREA